MSFNNQNPRLILESSLNSVTDYISGSHAQDPILPFSGCHLVRVKMDF